jgi:hypothetical protein
MDFLVAVLAESKHCVCLLVRDAPAGGSETFLVDNCGPVDGEWPGHFKRPFHASLTPRPFFKQPGNKWRT